MQTTTNVPPMDNPRKNRMAKRIFQVGASPVIKFIVIPRDKAKIAIGFLPNASDNAPNEKVPESVS